MESLAGVGRKLEVEVGHLMQQEKIIQNVLEGIEEASTKVAGAAASGIKVTIAFGELRKRTLAHLCQTPNASARRVRTSTDV